MARISRLIVYDANEKILAEQMAKSLPEGIHNKGDITITIINLSSDQILDAFVKDDSEFIDKYENPKDY